MLSKKSVNVTSATVNRGAQNGKIEELAPKNLFQLFITVFKSFILGIPKMFLHILIKFIVIYAIVTLFNIYMIADVNDGFWYDPTSKFRFIMPLDGQVATVSLIWAFAMLFIENVITRIKQDGIKTYSKQVLGSPVSAVVDFKHAGKGGLLGFQLILTVTTLLLYLLKVTNPVLLAMYAITVFFSYTKGGESFLLHVVSLTKNDFKRLFKIKKEDNLAADSLIVISLFMAFLLSTLFTAKTVLIYLGILLLVVIGFYLLSKRSKASKVVAMICFGTAAYIMMTRFGQTVFADDGGKPEAGGTWGKWINSQGAGRVVKNSSSTGLSSAIVAALGTSFRDKTFKNLTKVERRIVMDHLENQSNAANSTASKWDYATKTVEIIQVGADIGIDALEKVTGPAGSVVKKVYVFTKGVGGGVGEAMADPNNAGKHLVKGLVKGGSDLGKEYVGGWTKAGISYGSEVVQGGIDAAIKGESIRDGLEKGAIKGIVTAAGDALSSKIQSDLPVGGGTNDFSKFRVDWVKNHGDFVVKGITNTATSDAIKNQIINQGGNFIKGEDVIFRK